MAGAPAVPLVEHVRGLVGRGGEEDPEGLLGSCAAGTWAAAAASSWVERWVGRAAGMIGGGIAGAPGARKCPARAVELAFRV